MTAVASRPAFYEVKWAKSKKLLDAYIRQYNQDKPLARQLRQSHKSLAEHLLFLYSASLSRLQAYGAPLRPGDELPALPVNNVQLSNNMGCSERTIINLRARLSESGIIRFFNWRGTNSQYEIGLSPSVIHLQEGPGKPANAVGLFLLPSQAPGEDMTQNLRHTVTCYIEQDTNKLIELSGAPNQQVAESQVFDQFVPVDNCPKPVENTSGNVDLTQSGCGQVTKQGTEETGYETSSTQAGYIPPRCAAPPAARRLGDLLRVPEGWMPGPSATETPGDSKNPPAQLAAAPANDSKKQAAPPDRAGTPYTNAIKKDRPPFPEELPGSLAEALDPVDEVTRMRITGHVNVLYTAAMVHLYADKWIADTEESRARAALAEYFLQSNPNRWSDVAGQMLERILLAKRWLAQDEKRWVPLPARYFDVRNEKGFRATRSWYYKHMDAKQQIKDAELLTKGYNRYLASLKPGAKLSPAETYRLVAQTLGKRSKELLHQFHLKIQTYVNTSHQGQRTA